MRIWEKESFEDVFFSYSVILPRIRIWNTEPHQDVINPEKIKETIPLSVKIFFFTIIACLHVGQMFFGNHKYLLLYRYTKASTII